MNRIVRSGNATTNNHRGTVTFTPSLKGMPSEYAILITASGAALAESGAHVIGYELDAENNLKGFEVYTDEAIGDFSWIVVLLVSEPVTPLEFGAVGDGCKDDTPAIAAMLTARLAISTTFDGLGLTYKLTSTITKALSTNVSWTVRNFNFTTSAIVEPGAEQGAIKITGDELIVAGVWTGTNRIALDNVTFTHTNVLKTIGFLDGIQILKFDQVFLNDTKAKGYTNTGLMVELSRKVFVQNCEGISNLYAGFRGDNIYDAVVIGGTYNGNGILRPQYGYGIAFSAGDQVNSNINLLITGVTANGNQRKGIDFHAGVHVHVTNNNISGFGLIGIYALADTNGYIVRDVIIEENVVEADGTLTTGAAGISVGANGMLASAAGQYMVLNNIIKDCSTEESWAVEIDANSTVYAPDLVMVSGNRILTSGSATTGPIAVHGAGLPIGNVKICDNFIYTTAANYGIDIQNAINSLISGNSIEITGGTVTMGINVVDSPGRPVMISNNYLCGAAKYSGTITDFVKAPQATTSNNRYLTTKLKDVGPYGVCVDWGNDAPAAEHGYYGVGSVRWNTAAAAGGSPGWVCTTAGVTGSGSVWKTMVNVAA
jgi:hypothetical protein